VAQLRRWLPFGAAAIATVLLAGGFGLAASQLSASRSRAAPQLRTVPVSTLDRLGVSLAAAVQPPYCGLAGGAVQQGWLHAGSAGCAIPRAAAETAAGRGGNMRILESVLAAVTSTRVAAIGRDHLAWLVVTQGASNLCRQSSTGFAVCIGPRGVGWTQLVLVDAHGAGIFSSLRLTPGGAVTRPFSPNGTLNGG
jgi:hypothetical protein